MQIEGAAPSNPRLLFRKENHFSNFCILLEFHDKGDTSIVENHRKNTKLLNRDKFSLVIYCSIDKKIVTKF